MASVKNSSNDCAVIVHGMAHNIMTIDNMLYDFIAFIGVSFAPVLIVSFILESFYPKVLLSKSPFVQEL